MLEKKYFFQKEYERNEYGEIILSPKEIRRMDALTIKLGGKYSPDLARVVMEKDGVYMSDSLMFGYMSVKDLCKTKVVDLIHPKEKIEISKEELDLLKTPINELLK